MIFFLVIIMGLIAATLSLIFSKDPSMPNDPEINGERSYQDGYFKVTRYFKRDRVVAVKVESPKNDFALYAKKPTDPDDNDSMEFYKIGKLSTVKCDLKHPTVKWNPAPLVKFMQLRMNAWAKKGQNKTIYDPHSNVSVRSRFVRAGEQVVFK